MGFFSSILGGSSSSSSSGGFNQLPESIKGAYTGLGDELQNILKGNYTAAYTPTPLSSGEQSAIERLYAGFTPNQETLNSDIAMQMNPFDSYVIDEINRQAGGDYSILKQQQDSAGQLGSNRGLLGANDIDLSRLNQIGGFKQSQYNTALQNALNTLPGMRREDAVGALGAGDYSRGIDLSTSSAQITALQELAKALGILPTQEGSTTSKSSSSGGIGGLLQGGAAAYAASDIFLKENIIRVGEENGFPVYEFNYKANPEKRYRGVMAQDVIKTRPDAVGEIYGFLAVDYEKIGVEFREI